MQYIGFWKRFAAFWIDVLILAVVEGVLQAILGARGSTPNQALMSVLNLVVGVFYWVFYQGRMGQTLGKKALGIKVVTY